MRQEAETKLQVDLVDGFCRLSVGEFSEAFPRTSPLVSMLALLVDALGGWRPTRSVLIGHWSHEVRTAEWRQVALFPYRCSLFQSSAIRISEVPDLRALPDAIECGWDLPRLLLCVVDESSEYEIASLQSRQWRSVFEEEIPALLLSMHLSMLVLGFYHQRWISTYASKSEGRRLVGNLVAKFREELVEVDEEL